MSDGLQLVSERPVTVGDGYYNQRLEWERGFFKNLGDECGWHLTNMSVISGLARSTLYRKLFALGFIDTDGHNQTRDPIVSDAEKFSAP